VGKKILTVICGPTASGKTDIAIKLAEKYCCEVVSADSRQMYREMNIGTAKPTTADMCGISHHFIDTLHVSEDYNAGQYENDALVLLKNLFEKYDRLILAGGSGLYIKALCEGFDELPAVAAAVREEVEEDFKKKGIEFLLNELKEKDEIYFDFVDKNNPARIMRALEVIRASGKKFSALRKAEKKSRFFETEYFMPALSREELYGRINRRTGLMRELGLTEEVKSLLPFRHCNALQTVGYTELFDFFDGKICEDAAYELIKQHTRNYAKRQLTWFRKVADIQEITN
jgi:tRNA dimethylallyltransferase